MSKRYYENRSKIATSFDDLFEQSSKEAAAQIYDVNKNFINQIKNYFNDSILPEENKDLQERINKAATYYLQKFDVIYIKRIGCVYFDSDNKETKKEINNILEKFELALVTKIAALTVAISGFESVKHIKAVANAEIDFKPKFNRKTSFARADSEISNKDLYAELNAWRKSVSEESDVQVYRVLQQKTLNELVEKLPANLKQLLKIKGFGKVKVAQFGEEILEMIDAYCESQGIERDETEIEELKPKKQAKKDTKLQSFELFRQGKSVAQVAEERGFVESTIFGHLAHFVTKDELDIAELMGGSRLEEILSFLQGKNIASLSALIQDSNHKYSYNELRLVVAYMNRN